MDKLSEEIIRKKLNYFLKKKKSAHITKTNKQFLNVYISEKLSSDVYVLTDFYGKKTEIFIFEIFDVKKYQEKEE